MVSLCSQLNFHVKKIYFSKLNPSSLLILCANDQKLKRIKIKKKLFSLGALAKYDDDEWWKNIDKSVRIIIPSIDISNIS